MGLVYNVKNKKFDVSYEKTDYKTDRKTDAPTSETYFVIWGNGGFITYFSTQPPNSGNFRNARGSTSLTTGRSGKGSDFVDLLVGAGANRGSASGFSNSFNQSITRNIQNYDANINNNRLNELAKADNAEGQRYNNAYNTVLKTASNTQGGDYTDMRQLVRDIKGVDSKTLTNLEKDYKRFYQTEKLVPWDNKQGAVDPLGKFDGKWYYEQDKTLQDKWNDAVRADDIDITERYGNTRDWAWYNYTSQGKAAGKRGQAIKATTDTDAYKESAPTDAEIADIRKKQLGIKDESAVDRFLKVDAVQKQFQAAKSSDSADGKFWRQLGDANYLDPTNKSDFVRLFRLSDREQDKKVNGLIGKDDTVGITQLEDELYQLEAEKFGEASRKFGALAQDTLKSTLAEVKKAQAKEAETALYKGFQGISELSNINEEITNSILGDTGVGGFYAFGKGEDLLDPDKLETAISKLTGIRNNVSYNWQKYFDDELQAKYNKELELTDPEDAKKTIKVEAEFAKEYIDNYLKPRFDGSKSMDEFTDYIQLRQDGRNPFKQGDYRKAITSVATTQAEKYITDAQGEADRYFNADFYFDPKDNDARKVDFAAQKKRVNDDWDAARADASQMVDGSKLEEGGLGTWAQQAYKYGIDLNDKTQFGKMHFQIIGQGQGYDPTDDIINATKVSNAISGIREAMAKENIDPDGVFVNYETPEEYADNILESLDPSDASAYQEALKDLGLEGFAGTTNELRTQLVDQLQTGSAEIIRRQIKFLQERRKDPTQERLGITYIERDEDKKDKTFKGKSALFNTFQAAGYQGDEDEFYKTFMPDTSLEDQELLYQGASGKGISFDYARYTSPFTALGALGDMFEDTTQEDRFNVTPQAQVASYFRLGEDDDKGTDTGFEDPYEQAQGILGEFTDAFRRKKTVRAPSIFG
jgi:hypothetical protein